MRKIWTIVSVFAVGNLLALGGVIGWLGASGRLDAGRMRGVRLIFSETIAAQMMREAGEEEERLASEEAEPGARDVAISSGELMQIRLDRIEADRERRRRLEQEVSDLARALAQREATLASDREAFEADREAYRLESEQIRQTDGDRQFKKAVNVLAGMRASDAAKLISVLIETGTDGLSEGAGGAQNTPELRERGIARAVSYLNAMPERARLKLMSEISDTQPELAANLLERLRTRGMPAETAQAP